MNIKPTYKSKKRYNTAFLCLALVLVLLLCGCSAAGTYRFTRMEADGTVYDTEAVKARGQDPDSCYILLSDDGSGVLSIFGQAILIGWDDSSLWPDSAPDDAMSYQRSGSTLTLEYNGQKLIFSK